MPKRKPKGGFKPASNYIPKDASGRGQKPARASGNARWASAARREGAEAEAPRDAPRDAPRGDRARRAAATGGRRADAARPRGGERSGDFRVGTRAGERPDRHRQDAMRQSYGRQPAAGSRSDRNATHYDPSARPTRDGQPAQQREEDVVLERLAPTTISAEIGPDASFADLGLSPNIVDALADLGAAAPFPIQASTIPDAVRGADVLGRGRTGSGKTIAFGSALVQRLASTPRQDAARAGKGQSSGRRQIGRAPRALIVAPTRELALQIDRTVQPIARSVGLFTTQVYGGVPQQRQATALGRGVDIVIGTPGRIEDLQRQGVLRLDQVEITVLDEADQMCDLGFLEPMQRILRMTRPGGQRLLFSATLDAAVQKLVREFLHDPSVHEVAGEEEQHSDIDHSVLVVEREDKRAVVEQLAGSGGRVLIFTKTRLGAESLANELSDSGVPAVALHGDLTQGRRTHNLRLLTSGRVNVLVATDVAARGIHVDDIRLVIQADAPEEYKSYLHRSGRTGRAGQRGNVVTVIPKQRRRRMTELLDRADVEAPMIPARPGGRELDQFMVASE